MGDKKDSWDEAKSFQESKGDDPDSSKQFAAAEHQARNDAQDAGEGLGDRDRSSKADVPSKESPEPSSEKGEESSKSEESSEEK